MALLRLLPTLLLVAASCGPTQPTADDVAVRVGFVTLDERTRSPVVVLEEEAGSRVLPIWIGLAEARSIAAELEAVPARRPNTHDLAKRLIDRLEGSVERVVVTALDDGVYYAVLVVRRGGGSVEIDSRPSDAIAIALRTGAPVFVRESLFEGGGDVGEGHEI